MCHQVQNDAYHWSQIINMLVILELYTIVYRTIYMELYNMELYTMDYLENVTQSFKYEPHESHFNKKTILVTLFCKR